MHPRYTADTIQLFDVSELQAKTLLLIRPLRGVQTSPVLWSQMNSHGDDKTWSFHIKIIFVTSSFCFHWIFYFGWLFIIINIMISCSNGYMGHRFLGLHSHLCLVGMHAKSQACKKKKKQLSPLVDVWQCHLFLGAPPKHLAIACDKAHSNKVACAVVCNGQALLLHDSCS